MGKRINTKTGDKSKKDRMTQKKDILVLNMTGQPAKGSPNFACVPGPKERINGMRGMCPFTKVTMGVLETHLDWSMKLASLLSVPKVILISSKGAICEDKVEMINGRPFRQRKPRWTYHSWEQVSGNLDRGGIETSPHHGGSLQPSLWPHKGERYRASMG